MEHRLALSFRIDEQEEEIALPELVLGFKNHSPSDYFEAKDQHEKKDEPKNIRLEIIKHITKFMERIGAIITSRQEMMKSLASLQSAHDELHAELQRREQLGTEGIVRNLVESNKHYKQFAGKALPKQTIINEEIKTQQLTEQLEKIIVKLASIKQINGGIIDVNSLSFEDLNAIGEIMHEPFGIYYRSIDADSLERAEALGYLINRAEFLKMTPEQAIETLGALQQRLSSMNEDSPYAIKNIGHIQDETGSKIEDL